MLGHDGGRSTFAKNLGIDGDALRNFEKKKTALWRLIDFMIVMFCLELWNLK